MTYLVLQLLYNIYIGIIMYTIISLVSLYILWIFYLAVMSLKQAYDTKTLSKLAYVLGCPLLVVGLIIDLLVNIFVASVFLLDFPRELTVSEKLGRLIKTTGWRSTASCWFCTKFLDIFDPSGKHCK